ncbi:MAG: chorismate-binding protein [Bacteroidetes bacterium]|nr:chorismate-binding protein [Bacteroidota bacterium]
MDNSAKACYRIPFGELKFFEGLEESSFSFSNNKQGYIISDFEGKKYQFIPSNIEAQTIRFSNNHNAKVEIPQSTSKDAFIKYVAGIQFQIKTGKLDKVVASRCKQIELPENFDINKLIYLLCTNYENAYISAYQGQNGTYISASPELLLKKDNEGNAETVALAGTSRWKERENLGSKENEEQGLIVRHIQELLKKYGIQYEETHKQLLRAGHLAHLVNKYHFNLNRVELSKFLSDLHPTPAVGVYPHSAGVNFILQNEGWERGFYSGMSGILNADGSFNLSVNLRSISIHGRKAILHAGAGITQDSIPEKEWLETEEKMKTIENLI